MIERSLHGKYAKSVFFEKFNDVDIYIEDTSAVIQKVYVQILKRLLDGSSSVNNVFPLGNRREVARRCSEDQGDRSRPAVYVVDGDLQLLRGGRVTWALRRFYVLDRYCIENYLSDEDALVQLLWEEDQSETLDLENLKTKFGFSKWAESCAEILLELYAMSAVAQRYGSLLPLVAIPIKEFVSAGDGTVDRNKVKTKISLLEKDIDSIAGAGIAASDCSAIMSEVAAKGAREKLSYVSGKDMVIPLLFLRLRSVCNGLLVRNTGLLIRLAGICDVAPLSGLKAAIS